VINGVAVVPRRVDVAVSLSISLWVWSYTESVAPGGALSYTCALAIRVEQVHRRQF